MRGRRKSFVGWATLALGLILSLAGTVARAAIVAGTVTSYAGGTSASSWTSGNFTQSLSIASSADVLVVAIGSRNGTSGGTVSGGGFGYNVSYGTTSLSGFDVPSTTQTNPWRDCEIYYLYNPPSSGTLTFTNPNVTNYVVNVFSLSGVDTTQLPVFAGNGSIGSGLTGSATLSTSAAASVQPGAFAVLDDTINSGSAFTFSASNNGIASGAAATLSSTGESNAKIFSSLGVISGLSSGTNTFKATTTSNGSGNNMLAATVFEPISVASYSWSGTINGNWSLSGSDANWSGSGTAYSDSSNVTFPDAASNTAIAIAVGGVRPNSVLFTANTASFSFGGGPIAGPATVTLSASGLVTVSNSNTYSGSTTISSGTLQIGSGGTGASIGGTSGVLDNANLVFNHSDAVTFAPAISGSGRLTQTGSGLLVLTGSNTYQGATTVSAGTLAVNNVLSASSTVTVANGATFSGSGAAGPVVVAGGGAIAGGYAGAGGLSLTNLTFSGSGMLNLTPAAGIYTGVNVTANGGLIVNGANSVMVNINNSSPLALGAYALVSYAGTIGGTGSSSAFQIGATPATSGGTRPRTYAISPAAQAIDLTVSGDSPIWSGSNGSAWDTATSNWVLASNHVTPTTFYTADTAVFDDTAASHTVSINGSDVQPASVVFSTTGSYTLSGTNAIAGTATLAKSGNGILTINNSNTYTGGTTVNGGTLQFGVAGALPSSGTVNVSGATAVLDLGGFSPTVGAFLLSSGTLQNGALSAANYEVQSGSVLASLAGSGSVLVKTTSGLATLAASNSYTGSTTISGGTLQIGNGTSDGSIAASSNIIDNAALLYNLLGSQSYGGVISGSGAVILVGPGGLTLSGTSNTYGGGTSVSQGTLQALANGSLGATSGSVALGNGSTLGINGFNASSRAIAVVSGGSATIQNTLTSNSVTLGTISGGSLTVGGGNVVFSGNDTGLAGLTLTNSSNRYVFTALQALPPNLMVNSGVTVDDNAGVSLSPTGAMTFAAGADLCSNAGTLTLNTANLVLPSAGKMTFNGDFNQGSITINGSASVPVTGPLTIAMGLNQLLFNAATSGSGSLTLTSANGVGTLILAGSNSYSGSTTINNDTLQLGSVNALLNSTVIVNTANGLGFTLGTTATTIGGLSGGSPISLQDTGSNSVTLSVGNNGSSTTFSGVIGGSGGLVKIGSGSLTLAGTNSFAGGTRLASGSLKLNNSTALGAGGLNVNSGELNLNGNSIALPSLSGSGGVISDENSTPGSTTLTLSQSGGSTFAGTIRDGNNGRNLALAFSGGMLTLSASNNYSLGTTVSGGTLQLGNNSAIGSGPLTANAGTVDLASFSPSVAQLSGSAGTIINSVSGTATLTVNQSTMTTFSGAINDAAGQVALVKSAAGSLTLSGTNGYSGGTSLGSGVLVVNNAQSLGATTGSLAINTATLEIAGGFSESRNIALTHTSATIQVDAAQIYTNSGTISGSGALNKTGAGTLDITGATNVAGHANASGGLLQVDGSLSAYTINITGGAQLAGAGVLSTTGESLYYSSTAASTFAGSIAGNQAIEVDSGILTLSGTTNSYSGGTVPTGGTLALGANNALPVGTALTFGSTASNGTFDLAGKSQTIGGLIVAATNDPAAQIIGNSSTSSASLLTYSSTGVSNFSGTIQDTLGSGSMTTALAVSGGTLILSGTNGYTGGTTVLAGALIEGDSEALADGSSLTVGSASAFAPVAPSEALAGTGDLSAQSSGSPTAIASVPEPGTLALAAAGAALLTCVWRSRDRSSRARRKIRG